MDKDFIELINEPLPALGSIINWLLISQNEHSEPYLSKTSFLNLDWNFLTSVVENFLTSVFFLSSTFLIGFYYLIMKMIYL